MVHGPNLACDLFFMVYKLEVFLYFKRIVRGEGAREGGDPEWDVQNLKYLLHDPLQKRYAKSAVNLQ